MMGLYILALAVVPVALLVLCTILACVAGVDERLDELDRHFAGADQE